MSPIDIKDIHDFWDVGLSDVFRYKRSNGKISWELWKEVYEPLEIRKRILNKRYKMKLHNGRRKK